MGQSELFPESMSCGSVPRRGVVSGVWSVGFESGCNERGSADEERTESNVGGEASVAEDVSSMRSVHALDYGVVWRCVAMRSMRLSASAGAAASGGHEEEIRCLT